MKSQTIQLYGEWMKSATADQVAFVDAVYAECEAHYDAGGDTIVECYDPEEIVAEFKSIEEVRETCGLIVGKELETRWGDADDPQVERSEKCREWLGN